MDWPRCCKCGWKVDLLLYEIQGTVPVYAIEITIKFTWIIYLDIIQSWDDNYYTKSIFKLSNVIFGYKKKTKCLDLHYIKLDQKLEYEIQ